MEMSRATKVTKATTVTTATTEVMAKTKILGQALEFTHSSDSRRTTLSKSARQPFALERTVFCGNWPETAG
jgi:hypothetical protein